MIERLETKNGGVMCDHSVDSQTAVQHAEACGKPTSPRCPASKQTHHCQYARQNMQNRVRWHHVRDTQQGRACLIQWRIQPKCQGACALQQQEYPSHRCIEMGRLFGHMEPRA